MVSLVNSHTNATRIGEHLWEIDLRFARGLPPGWIGISLPNNQRQHRTLHTQKDVLPYTWSGRSAVERIRHNQYSQGQNLALA